MPIVLFRVDERLIHGQVVVGWGGQIRPDRYLVVDDVFVTDYFELPLGEFSLWLNELYLQ